MPEPKTKKPAKKKPATKPKPRAEPKQDDPRVERTKLKCAQAAYQAYRHVAPSMDGVRWADLGSVQRERWLAVGRLVLREISR